MNFTKITIKDVLLVALVGFIIFSQFFYTPGPGPLEAVIVTRPEISGTVEETLEEVPEEVVELPSKEDPKVITKVVVDKEYKEKYEKAIKENDSLAATNLFLRSIEINEYQKTLVDNDTLKIVAYAKTRGQLLKYNVDYTIKADTISYIPEVVKVRPSLTVLTGVELVVPISAVSNGFSDPMAVKVDVGFQNQKGNIISIGADTKSNLYLGYKHAIKLRKKKR